MNQEELDKLQLIIKHGYVVALDTCFNEQQMYAKGFLDGIRFAKTGVKPKSHINILFNKLESENNGTICNNK